MNIKIKSFHCFVNALLLYHVSFCGPGERIQQSAKESDWIGTENIKSAKKACDCTHVSVCRIKKQEHQRSLT